MKTELAQNWIKIRAAENTARPRENKIVPYLLGLVARDQYEKRRVREFRQSCAASSPALETIHKMHDD